MPVFLVTVNLDECGAMPELLGLVATVPSPDAAIAWTCANETVAVRNVDVETLTVRDDCWYQPGPILAQ